MVAHGRAVDDAHHQLHALLSTTNEQHYTLDRNIDQLLHDGGAIALEKSAGNGVIDVGAPLADQLLVTKVRPVPSAIVQIIHDKSVYFRRSRRRS